MNNRREFLKTAGVATTAAMLPAVAVASTIAKAAPEPIVDPNVLPTGIALLDEMLGGGLRKGRVYCVMGGAGSGKTLFAHQVSRQNSHRKLCSLQPSSEKPSPFCEPVPNTWGYPQVRVLDEGNFLSPVIKHKPDLFIVDSLESQQFSLDRDELSLHRAKAVAVDYNVAILITIQSQRHTSGSASENDFNNWKGEFDFKHQMPMDVCLNLRRWHGETHPRILIIKNRWGNAYPTINSIPFYLGGFTPPTRPSQVGAVNWF